MGVFPGVRALVHQGQSIQYRFGVRPAQVPFRQILPRVQSTGARGCHWIDSGLPLLHSSRPASGRVHSILGPSRRVIRGSGATVQPAARGAGVFGFGLHAPGATVGTGVRGSAGSGATRGTSGEGGHTLGGSLALKYNCPRACAPPALGAGPGGPRGPSGRGGFSRGQNARTRGGRPRGWLSPLRARPRPGGGRPAAGRAEGRGLGRAAKTRRFRLRVRVRAAPAAACGTAARSEGPRPGRPRKAAAAGGPLWGRRGRV